MSAVARLVAASFSFVPLQRWLNIAGVVLLASGLLAGVMMRNTPDVAIVPLAVLGMLGTILIVLSPGFAGGLALRFGSTRSMLHLRPYGRPRMMLAATLAITGVALLMILPVLASQLLMEHQTGRMAPRHIPPLQMLQVAWSFTVLLWIWTFVASRNRVLTLLICFAPLLVSKLSGLVQRNFQLLFGPIPLPQPAAFFVLAVAAWITFVIWYLRARTIRYPDVRSWFRRGTPEPGTPGTFQFLNRFSAPNSPSRAQALRQVLMGATSAWPSLLTGAVMTMGILGVGPFLQQSKLEREIPGYHLLVFLLVGAPLGLSMVGRSRQLWLRAGVDRAGLFLLAEKIGLTTYAVTLGIGVVGFVAIAVAHRPDLLVPILGFTATQITFALCLFYLGMLHTRAWTAQGVALGIGVVLLSFAQGYVLRPLNGFPPFVSWMALAVLMEVARLLRKQAQHRWLELDWRIAGFRIKA